MATAPARTFRSSSSEVPRREDREVCDSGEGWKHNRKVGGFHDSFRRRHQRRGSAVSSRHHPANARSAPLPQGQSAWLTPANVKPYAGFYADLQGTTLTVAYLSTQALSGKSCSADTHLEARSAALDTSGDMAMP